ncbi:NACHT domain-containing protein [Phytomonospora sp. NPDC050363]|uniref:NACHT domain-containing protein n=1 Tax=Phytomonospora sp. NPDC050363 TaxID=3155642 RepID=UPI0033CA616F
MRRTPVGGTIALVLLSTVALSLVVNVASAELPGALLPYRWLAWPLLLVLAGAVIVVTVRTERRDGPVSARGNPARTREVLLAAQHDSWIAGVLEQSLYAKARLRLEFATTVDEPHPWGVRVIAPGTEPRRLRGGQSITEIFDGEMRGWMLVLGEPGAGKTTTMLELLRDLLDRAEHPGRAVPLLVNLASWDGITDFESWLVKEAARRYRVPAEHLAAWLRDAELVLLLDGLDEVAEIFRTECLRAINRLREKHPTVPIVVCCRSREYRALGETLTLRGRVEIQPLATADVDRFLRKHRLAIARRVLDEAPDLRALVTTPLLLSVLMLAYREAPASADDGGGDPVRRLLTAYVRRMLVQRSDPAHPPRRVVEQLAFIAVQLKLSSRTIFTFDGVAGLPPYSRLPKWLTLAYIPVLAAAGWWWAGPGGAAIGALAGLYFLPETYHVSLTSLGIGLDEDGRRQVIPERNGPGISLASGIEDVMTEKPQLASVVLLGMTVGTFASWYHSHAWTGILHGLAAVFACLLARGTVAGEWYDEPAPGRTRSEVPSPVLGAFLRLAALRAAFCSVTVFGVALLTTVWWTGPAGSVPFATFAGVATGCYIVSGLGAAAVVEQWFMRRDLARRGLLDSPARGVLDHAADSLLLQRLGDDYLFPHLLLRDYFAGLWTTLETRVPSPRAGASTVATVSAGPSADACRIADITRDLR